MSLKNRVEPARLPDVLIMQQRVGYDFDIINQSIVIDFRQPEFLTRTIAGDSWRFVAAAFQTLAGIRNEIVEKDSLPWSLIRLYYAAFYSAHALMRLFGESCSRFDQKHIDRLATQASWLGKSLPFGSGQYHCVLSASASGFAANTLTGGVHEAFWTMFSLWIDKLARAVAVNPGSLNAREAQQVVLKLERLRDLTKSGKLSTTRNRVQYRHEFDVWFPATPPKRDRETLGRLVDQWNNDPLAINLNVPRLGELGEFVIACTFVIALCRIMLKRIEERSMVGRRSFIQFGHLAIMDKV